MLSPSKEDVLVERTVEFDFQWVGEHGRIFVCVILHVSCGTRYGVGGDQVNEDAIASCARDLCSSVVDDDVFGAFAEHTGCRTNDTTTLHDISCQFSKGGVIFEFGQTTDLLPILTVIVRQEKIDNLGKLISVSKPDGIDLWGKIDGSC